jgi:hypothetical protein
MEMYPDTLEAVGVNELFVAVTVDASFTTEQSVVGHIDEIQIPTAVRTVPMVGYLSPSQICDDCCCACRFAHLGGDFFSGKICFFRVQYR